MDSVSARTSVIVVSASALLARVASAVVIGQPGYTDAYYYVGVASRLARGSGLTADFVWNPLELGVLPVVSHRFWMPLATTLQAAGIALFGSLLGDFRAAQLVIVAIAVCLPPVTYACARSVGTSRGAALVAAGLAGLGGLFAPAWVSLDGFAPAAVLGALFFIAFARAAAGSTRAGLAAGLLVGLLYLLRAEAALFGLALLALVRPPASRRAGIAGAMAALAIGLAWLARDVSAGMPSDLLARSALLVRYDEFFALGSPTFAAFASALPDVLGAKVGALATNAITFIFAFAVVLVIPLVIGARALWRRADVRAWTFLAVAVWGAESLIWTLHSTRGSYFHSLAAFFAFGVAIAVAGGERFLASRPRGVALAWIWGTSLLVATLSVGGVAQWDASFNQGARTRAAAVDAIPAGTFLAIDAAAWRWISGRPVLVTPSDGLDAAACVVSASEPHATSLVLEEAHFRSYDALYEGGPRPAWLGAPIERGTVKIFPVVGVTLCSMAVR